MSIKTLFDKQKQSIGSIKNPDIKTNNDFSSEVESPEYIEQYQKSLNLYLQDVNFATASNFAKFGSARKYYENISNRITGYFPYDGSKADQLEFENNLNPFEKYIYLYEYPRSTGYVNFAPNGWGSAVGSQTENYGLPSSTEYITFYNQNDNNFYDPNNGLRENLRFIFNSGSTVEFWLKKDNRPNRITQTAKEVIFYSATTGSVDKDKRVVLYVSGGTGKQGSVFTEYYTDTETKFALEFDTGLATIEDSTWHHYALCYYRSTGGYNVDFYFDGVYKTTLTSSATNVDITGSMFSTIGSAGGKISGSTNLLGYGKLSGSIDEFRFWNTKRDAKQIGLNYFTNVGGGNNVYPNNKIGIYYKFNEGITGNSATDQVILDYAGRNCNGLFVGYTSNSRNTGSAITSTQDTAEAGTPVLYDTNPDVVSYLEEKLVLADEHDYENNFALKNSMPSWILDEDAAAGDTLVNFLQTLASYLDTLYLQITTLKTLKNKDYLNYQGKAPPFSDLLLTSNGFDLPSLFLNTDVIQSIFDQDNKKVYSEKISDLKNSIYKNIYNNLNIIYKSKGTENSIRYLLKSFGVDDEVYSLNIYSNNSSYSLEDTYINNSVKKKYIDFTPFSNGLNSSAVIYQDETDTGSKSFITGTANPQLSFTAECNVLIPEFPSNYDTLAYQTLTYNTSSLFGIRTATDSSGNTTIPTNDPAGLKVRLIYRDDKGYFSLSYPSASIELNSEIFSDVFKDQHWNVSVRLSPVSTGSSHIIEFAGYNNYVSEQFNSFYLTASISSSLGTAILSNNKRLYFGAERTNVTGAVAYPSVFKGLSARYWADRLTNEELKEHARNPYNYGREKPADPYTLATQSYVPKSETLLLHWDFSQTTSSDGSGNISNVYSIVSGSTSGNQYSVSPLENLVGFSYNGKGKGFAENATIGGKALVYSSIQTIPENTYSNQLINIVSGNEFYDASMRPQKYFFALENSMYDVISKNMLNMFATIVEYNNFVGEPILSYKSQYSKLKFFRKLFYDKIGNEPDLDKYIGVYKWIDDALDSILFNLLPASANASEKVRTIVESHILERSKVQFNLYPDKSVSGNDVGPSAKVSVPQKIDPNTKFSRPKEFVGNKVSPYINGPTIAPEGLGIEATEKLLSPLIPENPVGPPNYLRGAIAARVGNRK